MSKVEKNYKAGGRADRVTALAEAIETQDDNTIAVSIKINGATLTTSLEVNPNDYVAGPMNDLLGEMKTMVKSITIED